MPISFVSNFLSLLLFQNKDISTRKVQASKKEEEEEEEDEDEDEDENGDEEEEDE